MLQCFLCAQSCSNWHLVVTCDSCTTLWLNVLYHLYLRPNVTLFSLWLCCCMNVWPLNKFNKKALRLETLKTSGAVSWEAFKDVWTICRFCREFIMWKSQYFLWYCSTSAHTVGLHERLQLWYMKKLFFGEQKLVKKIKARWCKWGWMWILHYLYTVESKTRNTHSELNIPGIKGRALKRRKLQHDLH